MGTTPTKATWTYSEKNGGSTQSVAVELTNAINVEPGDNRPYAKMAMSDGDNQKIEGVVFFSHDLPFPTNVNSTKKTWKSITFEMIKSTGDRTKDLYDPCKQFLNNLNNDVAVTAQICMSDWSKAAHLTVFYLDN